jgi:hypothetical protein
MAPTDPEDRRAARLAAVRAERGTEARAREIADLENRREIAPPPKSGEVRVRSTVPGARPRPPARGSRPRTPSGKTAGTSFFGHPWSEWHQMVDTGLDHLADNAEGGATVTELELWRHVGDTLDLKLGDPRLPMPFLLRDITNRQFEDTGLVAAALVVTEDGTPSPDFFRLAVQLGKLPPVQAPRESGDADWTMNERQESFWRSQLDGLFAYHRDV